MSDKDIKHLKDAGLTDDEIKLIDYAINCTQAVREAKAIIAAHCFEHRIQSKADIVKDMMKTNFDDIADTLAEALNVIYAVKEALYEAEK